MKVFWICLLIALASVLATMTWFWPSVLASNSFLNAFVGHEILAFLIIILTITFASVANIHLAISRTQTAISNPQSRQRIEEEFAKPLQEETRSSAWLLFAAFVACFVAVLLKGQYSGDVHILSLTHGVAVAVVIINGLVLYDIYGTIFELVGVRHHNEQDGEETEDFTDESPPAG